MKSYLEHDATRVPRPGSQPIAFLSRRYHLSASHRLHVDHLGATENQNLFGKCNNPFGHGHNYVIQITVSGPVAAATGMVTNLADLDAYAADHLLATLDHQNLNTLEAFRTVVPTTENLAMEVWRLFAPYPHAILRRVLIEETGNNSFEYFGPHAEGSTIFE